MKRTFEPWIGSKYWTKGLDGKRVLILGESHYGEVGLEYAGLTIDVVREWGQKKRLRFFTVCQKLIQGPGKDDWVSDQQRRDFWEHVSFYNYVQSFPGPEPRYRPNAEMWAGGMEPFLFTLDELEPDVLIVLGYELAEHILVVPEGIRVCRIQHPSSRGFRYANWWPMIERALA